MVLYLLAVICALSYQLSWPAKMEKRLVYQEMMVENGNEREAEALLEDAKQFPVAGDGVSTAKWSFEDSYGSPRTFGGERQHEGIDIMASENTSGCLQIRSVCDGVIEQMGWLRLGGYRMGIRSKNGFYYYYAHMERYAGGLQKGDTVKAGELLGYMGNTGYGEEGTRGKFAVHLHFGIYQTVQGEEKSLNPYPFLRYLNQE